MKRQLLSLVTLALAGTMVFAQGKSETPKADNQASSGPVTIKLMMSVSQKRGVSAAVDAFNKAYEGKIHCDAEYLAFDNVFETLEILMSSKSDEYDVFAADGPNVAAYARRGYLTPLDSYISKSEFNEFTPSMKVEAVYDGKIYGAPMGDSALVMYYNTDLLKQAGVTYDFSKITPDHRISWEELVDIATAAKKKLDPDGSKGIIGIEFQQVGRTYQMNVLANDFGGANINEGGLSVEGLFTSEPWQKALTWYQKQVDDGIFSKGISPNDTSSYFMANKIIFYLGTTALPGTFDANGMKNYSYTYVPYFKGYEKNVTTCCGSWTVGMNPYSAKKDAAAEFIKYLCINEGSDVYIGASGMVPALTRQFTEELMNEKPFLRIAQYEGAHTSLVRAVTPAFNEYASSVNAMWNNVRNGQDPMEAAKNCEAELRTAFAEYQ